MHMTHVGLELLPYICDFSPYFSPCGTNRSLSFRRQRGEVWRVRSIRANQRALIWWISVHQCAIKTRAHFPAIDRISEIQWSRFNRALGESRINTWLRNDTPVKIGRIKSRSKIHVVGLWPTDFASSWPSKSPSLNQMVQIFCDKISINRCSLFL